MTEVSARMADRVTHGFTMSNIDQTIKNCHESISNWESQVEQHHREAAALERRHTIRTNELAKLDPDSDSAREVKGIIEAITRCHNFKVNHELPLLLKNLSGRREELAFWTREKKKFMQRLGK